MLDSELDILNHVNMEGQSFATIYFEFVVSTDTLDKFDELYDKFRVVEDDDEEPAF